jgi:hypothetical protein
VLEDVCRVLLRLVGWCRDCQAPLSDCIFRLVLTCAGAVAALVTVTSSCSEGGRLPLVRVDFDEFCNLELDPNTGNNNS